MFFNVEVDEIIEMLHSDKEKGLSEEEANLRLEKYGENILIEEKRNTFLDIFLSQFQDFLIIVLLIAAAVSFFIGEGRDAIMILVIVIVNALIASFQEYKADNELEALKELSVNEAKIIRDGQVIKVPFNKVVVGDIVYAESGDLIAADGRIIKSNNLKIDESSLTGESIPIDKDNKIIKEEKVALAERRNMVYSSGIVTYGNCTYIVTATGMDSEIGKVAKMITSQGENITPMAKKTKEIGTVLSLGCLGICIAIFIIGFIHCNKPLNMFMTSVSLAVAAIPEGLPSVITIVLSIGITRLSKKGAIIRKMHAVETLGSANVICSDKTGTLTQNKMSVEKVYIANRIIDKDEFSTNKSIAFKMLINVAYDCNDANLYYDEKGKEVKIGDSTEVALVRLAKESGIERERKIRFDELPFDSKRKMMSCIYREDNKYIVYVKGASDVLINKCSHYVCESNVKKITDDLREDFLSQVDKLSMEAYRVMGYAYKVLDNLPDKENVEDNLIFVGLTAMIDPPREEVFESIETCKKAGIKPVMITGDHKLTAEAIAKKLGILKNDEECISGLELEHLSDKALEKRINNISVYARVTPKDKVRIVKAYQKSGNIVAMSGDGVNDAAALKKADIGCAMGITGTDVAKSASDMILCDDNFSTIVMAVKEGRGVFQNIKKAIHFLISCNIGEIITLFFATILNYPMPLLPIHILWVNLVTDSLPALALGVDPSEENIMEKKPEKKDNNIFTPGFSIRVIFEGLLIGFVTLVGFWFGNTYYSLETGRTFAFLILCLSQLFHTFNVRAMNESLFDNAPMKNKVLILANIVSALLAIIIVIVPFFREIFELSALDPNKWDFVLTLSLVPLVSSEIVKLAKDLFVEENSLLKQGRNDKQKKTA
ncbi:MULTISPECIES: calcium-translocating P-type ATPase, PMCA-type [Anaerofustis]|uniref:calcium-translocating P-type ATPase, PMCA-type n=1 Tax=Anaerofustis TaxID=264995 RepID=UPI0011074F63|nr:MULTISPECIES: calcium-translocating P-type ATPase, PMCA-type [Anaerofustis]MCO8194151.1 calcium-translocating P-type ATPase, PMCA-type [Anaerofustis sp. NSJ-163]